MFIEHGKHVGDLAPVTKPLAEFVSATSKLAKRAKGLASRSKCMALLCHNKQDIKTVSSFEEKLRCIWTDIQGVTISGAKQKMSNLEQHYDLALTPVMADIPAAALALPSK